MSNPPTKLPIQIWLAERSSCGKSHVQFHINFHSTLMVSGCFRYDSGMKLMIQPPSYTFIILHPIQILKVTKRHQDDVTLIAPDLFPHLAANVAQALHAIGTLHVTAAVAQHSGDLSISGQHRSTPVPSSCSRCWHVLALARLALFPPSLFFGMLRY